MSSNKMNNMLKPTAIAAALLLVSMAASAANVVVPLTAQSSTAALPDGGTVPMWGFCMPAPAAGTTAPPQVSGPACSATWSVAPTITLAVGDTLEIDLSNQLKVPTSIVILGQLGGVSGGGLGSIQRALIAVDHNSSAIPGKPVPGHSGATWPAGDTSVQFTSPDQAKRALSFAPETAPGGTGKYTWNNLKPGTYIYETGSRPSLQAPMGLYGTLIVTQAAMPAVAAIPGGAAAVPLAPGAAYPGALNPVPYDADVAMLFSEIDPLQNKAVDAAANAAHADTNWEMYRFDDARCAPGCYPPAVNYSPRYFLINGQAFDATAPQAFNVAGDVSTGNVLLRFLNAGLRTHVPTVAGTTVALMAEDGNLAPGKPKIQSEVLLTAGKTYDVLLTPAQIAPTYAPATFSVFDRALNLTNNNSPFGGLQALIRVNGAGASTGAAGGVPAVFAARAVNDVFTVPAGGTIKGNVRLNDFGVTTVTSSDPAFTLAPNGDFTYKAATTAGSVSFTYYANNTTSTSTSPISATVTFTVGSAALTATNLTFTSKVATAFTSSHPGLLGAVTNTANTAMTAVLDSGGSCANPLVRPDGTFTVGSGGSSSCTLNFHLVDAQGTSTVTLDASGNPVPTTATVIFPAGSGITVAVLDTQTRLPIPNGDYSWVIEEDRMFQHSGDPAAGATPNTLATNFHVSHMPLVASGCTGPLSCGDANTVNGKKPTPRARSLPGDVALDFSSNKRYYLSVVPADASTGAAAVPPDPTIPNDKGTPAVIGHGMGGVGLLAANSSVTVLTPQNPLPVANLSVYVFEDNSPTNGSVDEGEPGLGGFQVKIFDVRGSSGDAAGEMTYDLAGMPLTNGLIGKDGCKQYPTPVTVGTIYTCPNAPDRGPPPPRSNQAAFAAYQAQLAQDAIDYKLAGMALVPNMIPGRVTVEVVPNTARSIAGEKWVQVSTLEGGKPVDTFVKAGEPAYWQEFGAPGFHSFIGFMNPDHVAATNKQIGGTANLSGVVSSLHMDRPSQANLNDSCINDKGVTDGPADAGCRAALQYTTCYVSLNTGVSGTGQNVSYTECDADGNFTLNNVPTGQHELVIWDQWLDQIIAKKAVSIPDTTGTGTVNIGHVPVFSWFTKVEQSAYIDLNKNGVRDDGEPGLAQVPMTIRFRDGSVSNFLSTDGDGVAAADELFPLFNWYVIESDTTRYKGTGVNVIYDSGGKPDTKPMTFFDLNGKKVTKDLTGILNSVELHPLTNAQQLASGAKYSAGTTARIDPGTTLTEGLQGFINQTAIVDWGKAPYDTHENGGITGMVYYASTRGFDDPRLEVQFSWEPAVPRVPVNLYQKVLNKDGTVSFVLIDKTTTSSWDDNVPLMNCPGQANEGANAIDFVNLALGNNATKCYDGQHVFNQVQPAPYDGRYRFPSGGIDKKYLNASGSLLPGTYVVEVVPPAGYEIVKEEDKNILIGEPWNALGETQFLGVGNIFILPDTATLNDRNIAGAALAFPACVGALHTVPDYLTLFSDNQQDAPYAGAERPLCDRKEVALSDQTQVNADFQVFTPTPVAAHFVGMMLNDAAAEFDPISPSFGEKAALPNAPVSIRDFNGVEILRTYNDKWGTFNGLTPSTLAVNVPNPSGYSPNMLTTCMNDPGPILDTRPLSATKGQMITDPMYNPMFSNFCYVWPFMPGSTVYLDTPVLPTAAFASASTYQPVDCQYPDATPAIKRVDGPSGPGPWVLAAAGSPRTLTITALGDTDVLNPAYSGPTATTPGTTTPKVKRHYGFGATGSVVLRSAAGVDSPLTGVSWSDTKITGDVPGNLGAGYSGQLVIVNGTSHRTSVDTVTVSVETTAPVVVKPTTLFAGDPTSPGSLNYPQPVQTAIDAANPGDLIILEAGSYPELVVMWKPVRLQGVGAASVMINATKFPNRKVADWRGRVNALFGVDPIADTVAANAQVSPLPGQTLTGGIVLLEPTVLSTEEGAGITVLANDASLATSKCPTSFARGQGPVVTVDASGATTPDTVPLVTVTNNNPSWSNFNCAASGIDGVTVTGGDSGGGIYVNGWAHRLQIANNRVYGNAGPFSGGVRIGQPYLEGAVNTGVQAGGVILGYNKSVNVHHNAITTNGMVEGNAAAGATAAGGAGGGLSICSGTDNYKVNYNFICGNFASSDGGGMGHIGLSNNGSIAFNTIIFNESFNQTSAQNGGGLVVEGETTAGGALSPGAGNVTIDANVIQGNFARSGTGGGLRLQDTNGDDVLCEINNDCGPNQTRSWLVTVTNNIIANNLSGSAGGGVSLANSFGALFNNNTIVSNDSTGIAGNLFNTVVGTASTGPITGVPGPAGIVAEPTSLQLLNALPAARRAARQISTPTLVNNIIWQNRSFFFDGTRQDPVTKHIPLVSSNTWADAVVRAGGIGTGGYVVAESTTTGACDTNAKVAYWDLGVLGDTSPIAPPVMTIAIVSATHPVAPISNAQQHVITFTTAAPHGLGANDPITISGYTLPFLAYNVTGTVLAAPSTTTFTVRLPNTVLLPVTPAPATQQGVLGGAALQAESRGLHPTNSVLTPSTYALYAAQSTAQGNIDGGASGRANFVKQYCNGPRQIPGVQFEPGTPFQPSFQLDAAATLDESGNFVDLHFGPISLGDPLKGNANGDYHLPNTLAPSYARAVIPPANNHDVDNNARPRGGNGGSSDIGADQFTAGVAAATLTPNPLAFGAQAVGTTSAVQLLTYANTGTTVVTFTNATLGAPNANNFAIPAQSNGCTNLVLLPNDTCTIGVTFTPSVAGARFSSVTVTAAGAPTQTVLLTGTGTGGPGATLAPTPMVFGSIAVGATSPVQFATYTNTGTTPLTIALTVITGNYAVASNTCTNNLVLAPAATCSIGVTFQPRGTGARNGTLTITDRAGGATPQTVNLTGTGLGVAIVGFSWNNNGAVGNWGTNGGTRNIVVTNTGTGNLTFTALPTVTGGSQFALAAPAANAPCTSTTVLTPGQVCRVAVTRTRPVATPFAGSATLTLSDSGAVALAQTLNLAGN